MVQGEGTKKNASVQKKVRQSKKNMGPKKGPKAIAPKKNNKIKEQRLKLHLTKSINASIESELASKAGGNLKVVQLIASKKEKKLKEKRCKADSGMQGTVEKVKVKK